MWYKGYSIERQRGKGYYLVHGLAGEWIEDTVEDAKAQIDELEAETKEMQEVLK